MVAVKTCKGKKHYISNRHCHIFHILFLLLALSLASDKEKLLKEVRRYYVLIQTPQCDVTHWSVF